MSPQCRCGSFVSKEYVRVFAPEDFDGDADVRACPTCNLLRDRNGIREARGGGRHDVEVALDG